MNDRTNWDREWGTRKLRRLTSLPKLDLSHGQGADVLVSATIAEIPAAFSDRILSESESCPVCGGSTVNSLRVAATLHLCYESGLNYGMTVWAHQSCFDACPETEKSAPIPW